MKTYTGGFRSLGSLFLSWRTHNVVVATLVRDSPQRLQAVVGRIDNPHTHLLEHALQYVLNGAVVFHDQYGFLLDALLVRLRVRRPPWRSRCTLGSGRRKCY